MSDLIDRVDEPVITGTEVEQNRGVELTSHSSYTAPLDGSYDDYQAADQRLANAVYAVLKSKYWGYPWNVKTEIRQGMIAFQLPELMGRTLHVFIRIKDYNALSDKLILDTAGNLLERMGLPRGYCDMDAYRAAKLRLHTFDFGDVKR